MSRELFLKAVNELLASEELEPVSHEPFMLASCSEWEYVRQFSRMELVDEVFDDILASRALRSSRH